MYVEEPDSSYFVGLTAEQRGPLWTSEVTRQEFLCTLYRKESDGALERWGADQLCKALLEDELAGLVSFVPNLKGVASASLEVVKRVHAADPPVPLRSLDTLHVASARAIRATSMVSTDARLRRVATLMALEVLP